MGYIIPQMQKPALRAALAAEGWKLDTVAPDPAAWWLTELWRLRSRRRPKGASLYVSLCAEPAPEGAPPGAETYAVYIGAAPARYDWDREHAVLHLGAPSPLEEIVEAVERVREAAGARR